MITDAQVRGIATELANELIKSLTAQQKLIEANAALCDVRLRVLEERVAALEGAAHLRDSAPAPSARLN